MDIPIHIKSNNIVTACGYLYYPVIPPRGDIPIVRPNIMDGTIRTKPDSKGISGYYYSYICPVKYITVPIFLCILSCCNNASVPF